ncbi:MAG: Rne/Rng family ribonuclease [Candidatus Tectomicrobia bacterium]|uniref:Rne/Rng family ribonuclease n=1 Tax=Tectimicrobiota bacterium TaxID=2528274 RepID=A0A932FZG2_UNCTE|nr:Rne/Rng family ribonuclease [Candidatus Tectomicrobia bacterium]
MSTEIIINANTLETRVAVLENHMVAELYIERSKDRGIMGNVYKGRILNVLPGMQAAFVDIGLEKAGFLYVSDVDFVSSLEEYEEMLKREPLEGGEKIEEVHPLRRRNRLQGHIPIEEMLQKGQEILVQVSKDPLGTKGPRLTSYITLPGRYLVFMPTIDQIGISRRIEDEEERRRLKELIRQLKEPRVGYIVRTASEGKSLEDFVQDVTYLNRLWRNILEKSERVFAPCLVHRDLSLILRTIRDLFTQDIDRLVIDSLEEYHNCLEFIRTFSPQLESKVELYTGKEPIFDAYNIELEINKALGRKIWLESGGYIIIEQTEALCAIDVNTGRFVGERDPEETVLKTNLEAIKKIVHQIRLRNIGGLIIIDFIDMEKEESKEKVFRALEDALKRDRSKTNILKVSELGLVEMTRQRVRESLERILCQPCPDCEGTGRIRSTTTVCYEVFREIQRVYHAGSKGAAEDGFFQGRGSKAGAVETGGGMPLSLETLESQLPPEADVVAPYPGAPPEEKKFLVTVHPDVADLIYGEESTYLDQLEKVIRAKIIVKVDKNLHREDFEVVALEG